MPEGRQELTGSLLPQETPSDHEQPRRGPTSEVIRDSLPRRVEIGP